MGIGKEIDDFHQKVQKLVDEFPHKENGAFFLIYSKQKREQLRGRAYLTGVNFEQIGHLFAEQLLESPKEYSIILLSIIRSYLNSLDRFQRQRFISLLTNYSINIDKELTENEKINNVN